MRKEIVTVPGMAPSQVLSQATRFSDLLFVASETGKDPAAGEYKPDIKAQTRQTLEDIKTVLKAAGSSLDQVLSNTCYITRLENFAGFNEVYLEFFSNDRPARTTVQVGLMAPDALVEITATAWVPS